MPEIPGSEPERSEEELAEERRRQQAALEELTTEKQRRLEQEATPQADFSAADAKKLDKLIHERYDLQRLEAEHRQMKKEKKDYTE